MKPKYALAKKNMKQYSSLINTSIIIGIKSNNFLTLTLRNKTCKNYHQLFFFYKFKNKKARREEKIQKQL